MKAGTDTGDYDRGHSQENLAAPQVTGSKGAAGAWQRIVSIMPEHRVFIEAFAGGAAVTRHKRPAEQTILIERDPYTAEELRAAMCDRESVTVIAGNAFEVLAPSMLDPAEVVLYCDPPYLLGTRKTPGRIYYKFDWSDADHVRFLDWISAARCPVIISGYYSELYAARLAAWRTFSFGVATRRGRAVEHVWCNFQEPKKLHETGHVGQSFTDRQRIKRKAARWVRMLRAMPAAERAAVREAIGTIDADGCAIPEPSASMRACIDGVDSGALELAASIGDGLQHRRAQLCLLENQTTAEKT